MRILPNHKKFFSLALFSSRYEAMKHTSQYILEIERQKICIENLACNQICSLLDMGWVKEVAEENEETETDDSNNNSIFHSMQKYWIRDDWMK